MTSNEVRPFRIRTITAFVDLHPDDFADEVVDDDVNDGNNAKGETLLGVYVKVNKCATILRELETAFMNIGYEVQTLRIATNPFGEWLTTTMTTTEYDGVVDDDDALESTTRGKRRKIDGGCYGEIRRRLSLLDGLLASNDISFCSLGPSTIPNHTTEICPVIVSSSHRFSCSANVDSCDLNAARAASACMIRISKLGDDGYDNDGIDGGDHHVRGGIGNFRFCASSRIDTVPFFPGARSPPVRPTLTSPPDDDDDDDGENDETGGGGECDNRPRTTTTMMMGFAIGLENGGFARMLLEEAKTISEIKRVFNGRLRDELLIVQGVCTSFVSSHHRTRRCDDDDCAVDIRYMGIDTSLNPSLDDGGSVADAIECLGEVCGDFGRYGTMAAASAITTSLQSIPDVLITGYCGLMLPVLEDRRLAELASVISEGGGDSGGGCRLTIDKIMCISSVCGVGVDTVPIPGKVDEDALTSLILDVAALAGRWDKPLSCRVFPVPGKVAGEMTTFDSPYLCNSRIFDF
ncbi:hypothetical protein ACHAXA_003033 [Cyclostephanos tholiformis]|uniref:DUF711 family protein n=1 Tax=Cyclostephanos tholiformis TaxID=382380 RepID=A0ABD3RE60_9STRA